MYAPESTGAVLCGQKQMAEVSFKFLDSQNYYCYNNTVTSFSDFSGFLFFFQSMSSANDGCLVGFPLSDQVLYG